MTIEGSFVAYDDVNPGQLIRVFSKFARSPREIKNARKGKIAGFSSKEVSIAEISSQLTRVGRIIEYHVV